MGINHRSEIEWAPKVSLAKIRLLYLREAQGICDDELVDEVGANLLARCASILEYSEAVGGRVKCKRCDRSGLTTIIQRKTMKPDEWVKCPQCGWQVRWRVYLSEAEKTGGNLGEGNAGAAFRRFLAAYPACQVARDKIVAIDLLIHEFHWNLVQGGQDQQLVPHKPAGVNLLQGSSNQVLEMLNTLTYGQATPPEVLSNKEWWLAQKPVAQRFGGE